MITQAMLMAAGLGTRLRPFTSLEPKAFLPLMGVPMAQFAVDSLAAAGVQHIVMNLHHLADRAREGAANLDTHGARITISDESALLLGSAGGIRKALPHFGSEPFFYVNADVLSDVDFAALARTHERMRTEFGVLLTLTVFESSGNDSPYREIVFDRANGFMTQLGDFAVRKPVFVGAAAIEPEALALVPDGTPAEFIPMILLPALERRKVGVYASSGLWYDVGNPELWLGTHLALIERMESDTLKRIIRRRIEAANERVAPGIWCARGARPSSAPDWRAPCYWNPWGDPSANAPRELGPRALLYGSGEGIRNSIGFKGVVRSVG